MLQSPSPLRCLDCWPKRTTKNERVELVADLVDMLLKSRMARDDVEMWKWMTLKSRKVFCKLQKASNSCTSLLSLYMQT